MEIFTNLAHHYYEKGVKMVARPNGADVPDDSIFDKTNLTNFSDAVIAIAITLLVLELRLPAIDSANVNASLLPALMGETPVLISFCVGFFVIASFWLKYHRFMKHVIKLDNTLTTLNILFIFFIAFLPFPTSILGMYAANSAVVIFYAITITCASVMLYLMRAYAVRCGAISANVDPQIIRTMQKLSLINCAVILASIPVGLLSPSISIIMWVSTPVFGWANGMIERKN